MGRQGARPPPRHERGRASRRRPHDAPPREVRLRGRRGPGGPARPGGPGRAGRRGRRPDHARLGDARQQRGRHASSRSARSPTACAPGGASSSTSTRSRRRRRWTWTWASSARTWSRSRPTSSRGPRASGALWVRRGTQLLAQVHGGSQERHRRAGTENVAGAVGMSVAYECACADRPTTAIRLRALRSRLAAACLAVDGVELTGHPTERLPGLLSLLVRGADGVAISVALDLDGIAASTGSACATGSPEPSHVLTAMGYTDAEALGALRLSLGRATTDAEVSEACLVVPRVIAAIRDGLGRPGRGSAGRAAGGLSRHGARPRRDVGRGRQLGRRRPRGGGWPRRGRRLDARPRGRGRLLGAEEELLLRGRGRGRAARRGPARRPVLRPQPGARVRGRRDRGRSSPPTSAARRPARAWTATAP